MTTKKTMPTTFCMNIYSEIYKNIYQANTLQKQTTVFTLKIKMHIKRYPVVFRINTIFTVERYPINCECLPTLTSGKPFHTVRSRRDRIFTQITYLASTMIAYFMPWWEPTLRVIVCFILLRITVKSLLSYVTWNRWSIAYGECTLLFLFGKILGYSIFRWRKTHTDQTLTESWKV